MTVVLVNNNGIRKLVDVPAPELTIVVQMGRMSVTYQLWSVDGATRLVYRETGSQIGFRRL